MKKYLPHLPQIIIISFIVTLFFIALKIDIAASTIFNDLVVRLILNSVVVVSLIPMVNSGAGLNFGVPVGAVSGLLGMVITANAGGKGLLGFFCSIAVSMPFAIVAGAIYGRILNKVKGREEIAATFIGFSIVSIMCLFWVVAPFTHPQMVWILGQSGLRNTIGLKDFWEKSLYHFMQFRIGELIIPVGSFMFIGMILLFLFLFSRTKTGMMMNAAGENESFARINGVNIEGIRILSVIISTTLVAIGTCIYAQQYGFIELYDAPLMASFPAVSALLLGGSSGKRFFLRHALLGVVLYQSLYLLSLPVANMLLMPQMAEIIRMIVTSCIILYALAKISHVSEEA
ncbi:MAG: ABC transporter permease [Desulfobacterales bacterium]|nr:ABC transporter permease [Desulfobacterales bacterium]